MTKIKQQRQYHEFSSLEPMSRLGQNNHTTKQKAVQPSRHPLAIFSPNTATGEKHLSLQDIHNVSISYGGLIGVNTRPKGNSPSRLFAVVETCRPILGWQKLTKQKGNPRMNKLSFTQTTAQNTITPQVNYVVKCQALGIYRMFDDKTAAQVFAEQLQIDYPHHDILRLKGYLDTWGNE